MKKIYLMALLILLAIPIVSAATYKNGEAFQLNRECFYNGDVCDNTFVCNITVYNKSSAIVDNQPMTYNAAFYNYSMDPIYINGEYRVSMFCSDGTYSGAEIFYFDITPTGDDRGNTLVLILILGSVATLILAFIFSDNIFGFISGALFLVTGVYSMIYGIAGISDMYTRAVSFVCLGIGALLLIVSAYNQIDDKKLRD